MLNQCGDLLARLGGADQKALKKVPAERQRLIQMALVLLTTAAVAALSMMFALHDGVGVAWVAAVIVGLFWGFVVILNLDRFLVLTMGSARGAGRLLALALPRLLMAIVLAAVVSTPLVLRIFASDINTRIDTAQLQRSQQQKSLEATSKEQAEADALQKQIDTDQAIVDGKQKVAGSSPALEAAEAEVKRLEGEEATAQKAATASYDAWACELYGKKNCGGSGDPGNGGLAQEKERVYRADARRLQGVQADLQKARGKVTSASDSVEQNDTQKLAEAKKRANDELPDLREKHQALVDRIEGRSARNTTNNENDTGILAQISALYSAGDENSALFWAHWAVFALFFMIEILPVLVKILVNLGEKSAYEAALTSEDDRIKAELQLERDHHLNLRKAQLASDERIEEGRRGVREKIEQGMQGKEEELGRHANDHVATHMEGILDKALEEWSARVNGALATPRQRGVNGAKPTTTSFLLPDGENL